MKKIAIIVIILLATLPNIAYGSSALAGRILLQVEDKGQVWYVNPINQNRYSLGRPDDAFAVMRELGIGITNADLKKIPVASFVTGGIDSDADGIPNNAETALGTNLNNRDSDNDGYNDLQETLNGYNPIGSGRLPIDNNFAKLHLGKIFLQIQSRGEAWYLNPTDLKRYYLGNPGDAFVIMRNSGLGITNADLAKLPIGELSTIAINTPEKTVPAPIQTTPLTLAAEDELDKTASAIRAANVAMAISYFTPNLQKSVEYSLNHMATENLLVLANILSGSTLKSSSATRKTYYNDIYFHGETHRAYFYVDKQFDNAWLITNL